MKLLKTTIAAAVLLASAAAGAQTSTFINNGGVHETAEYGSNTFQNPPTASLLDKYTFELAAAVADLQSNVAFVGVPPLTGSIQLWSDGTTDMMLGSYAFGFAGMHSFGALAAGNYYYLVSAAGAGGGGYTFGSYITPVPEPGVAALLLAGLGVISVLKRRRG